MISQLCGVASSSCSPLRRESDLTDSVPGLPRLREGADRRKLECPWTFLKNGDDNSICEFITQKGLSIVFDRWQTFNKW